MATTRITDLIVPEVFEKYSADETTRKLNIVQAGVMSRDENLDTLLNGGGKTFNFPFYDVLTDTGEFVATDDPNDRLLPEKTSAKNLIVPACTRTCGYEVANLDKYLTGDDPMTYIVSKLSDKRMGLLQKQFLSVVKGIFANNATASDDYHSQNDQRLDISGSSYSKGTTDFSVFALIDAIAKMGDAQDGLGMIMVHSLVFSNMQKQDIIATRLPSDGVAPTYYYNGYQIIVNDLLPHTNGVCSSYIFGRDQFRLGFGSVTDPIADYRDELGGNGMGITTIVNRWRNAIAPKGYSFINNSLGDEGGPSNTEFETAASWRRVCGSNKTTKMIELVTREV